QNFVDNGSQGTGNGILIAPTSGPVTFVITNTTVANNTRNGIYYFPLSGSFSADGVIDRVVAATNGNGIGITTNFVTGGTTVVAVSNSIMSANSVSANNGSGIEANNTGSGGTL